VRIPASQILHVFDPLEAGQIRGLSRLTPAIVTLWMLDLYDDAELERKKTAALFSVFIKRPDPDGEFFDKETTVRDDEGVAGVKLEPGSSHVLFPGETSRSRRRPTAASPTSRSSIAPWRGSAPRWAALCRRHRRSWSRPTTATSAPA
jgi:hypothetical protein